MRAQGAFPRLLIVSTVAATLSAFLLPFCRHYRSLGWTVDAAASDIDGRVDLQKEFDACHRLPLSRNPADLATLRRAPRAIRELVRGGNYDIVHVHTPVAAFLVRFALRARGGGGPRVVYTAHGFHFHRNGRPLMNSIFRFLEKLAARWSDAVVVINREDLDAAQEAKFPTRLVFMPGIGVDTRRWAPGQVDVAAVAAVRRELGLGEDDVLFLMVAEFNPGKRHRDVLAALQQLQCLPIHVAFAGDGPLRPALERQAQEEGLGGRTHFLGFRRDIPVMMRASRAVVLPSEREGLPRSLLEALSMGVPIVGADTRGVSELAGEGCGLLHNVGDVARLADALRRLARDGAEAAAMGGRGRARMVRDYDEQAVIRLHDALYADLLKD